MIGIIRGYLTSEWRYMGDDADGNEWYVHPDGQSVMFDLSDNSVSIIDV